MVKNIDNGPASEDPRDSFTTREEFEGREDVLTSLGKGMLALEQVIEARQNEDPLTKARRELIDLRNRDGHGETIEPAEIAEAQERVMKLEEQARSSRGDPQ